MSDTFDAIVLGAGAAGLMCAARAGQRGKRVLVLEKAEKPRAAFSVGVVRA